MQVKAFIKRLGKFVAPMVLWLVSFYLANLYLPNDLVTNPLFLLGTLAIALMGSFSQFTSWSIGGDNGVRADSLGKYAQFSGNSRQKSYTYRTYSNNDEVLSKLIQSSEKEVTKA